MGAACGGPLPIRKGGNATGQDPTHPTVGRVLYSGPEWGLCLMSGAPAPFLRTSRVALSRLCHDAPVPSPPGSPTPPLPANTQVALT